MGFELYYAQERVFIIEVFSLQLRGLCYPFVRAAAFSQFLSLGSMYVLSKDIRPPEVQTTTRKKVELYACSVSSISEDRLTGFPFSISERMISTCPLKSK